MAKRRYRDAGSGEFVTKAAAESNPTGTVAEKLDKRPDVERVSAKVHEAWVESKLAQGVTSRKSETGEELMVPYDQLSENAKDLDRGTVKAVLAAMEAV